MKINLTQKTIERHIIRCLNCQNNIPENNNRNNLFNENFTGYEYSQSLNSESTIHFYSSNSNSFFFYLIENRFPPELPADLVAQIKVIVSNENPEPVVCIENLILINPDYSIHLILEDFEKAFISLFNKNSKNGFKKSIYIESTLFGRGNQLGKQKTVVFSDKKLKTGFLSEQKLLDTESLSVNDKAMYFNYDSGSFHSIDESQNEMIFHEKCSGCNTTSIVNVRQKKYNTEKIVADKIISFVDANEKLPFFSRAKPEQLQLVQLLFSGKQTGEVVYYNNFLKNFTRKNPNTELFIVNSDLLSEKPDPLLFVNDSESFSKIIMEVLRGTIMWRKDKFLDFHSVSKLSGSKLKIHDPLHILGETVYKNKILDWICELEEKNPENFGFGFKTIFR